MNGALADAGVPWTDVDLVVGESGGTLKYYQNTLNGYLLIDLSEARLQAEFWMVPQVGVRTDQQFLDRSYAVDAGRHRLQPMSTVSEPIADAPLPAP